MESVRIEEERESLKCFRCDLGFWDVCYTTETNCSLGERCFTGRGKAGVMNETIFSPSALVLQLKHWRVPPYKNAFIRLSTTNDLLSPGDSLDIKTLGCARAEECDIETTVELLFNKTIFVMTKHCCDTPFCNTANKLQTASLFYLTLAALVSWHLTEASAAPQ